MKKLLKSIAVAFSMYSKIPMPRFQWASDDMKLHLCFFPWIGAVIGGLEWGWKLLQIHFGTGAVFYYGVAMAIPLLVTGGFHMDGFLDTMDALHSYQSREKKLEILKDPHVGAFAIISLVVYMLLAVAFISEVKSPESAAALCFSFFTARAFSGIGVTYFPKARKDGMVHTEAVTADKRIVGISLIVQLILCTALMLYVTLPHGLSGVVSIVMEGLVFLRYYFICTGQFGGVTGDTSGFFVTVAELSALMGVSLCAVFGV